MSVVSNPKEPGRKPAESDQESAPGALSLDDLARMKDAYASGGGFSPVRKLQTELVDTYSAAEPLRRPRVSITATLATIAVLCLALTVAALYLVQSA